MAQKKLLRFAELATFSNVLQFPTEMQGTWHEFFENFNPIVLELACGKGEYSIGLAQLYPNKNFIGIDIKGNRLWVGAKKAQQLMLKNVSFLRIQIEQITSFFTSGEVEEIWITYPDPQLRISKAKKRLTHPAFLRLYQQLLKPGGKIHLKTDSPGLYEFTRKVINMYGCNLHREIDDVFAEPVIPPELRIKTYYETLDIANSRQIHYLCFSLPDEFPSAGTDIALQQLLKEEAAIFENNIEKEEGGSPTLTDDDFYYVNDSGFTVLTAEYLLQRGYCCGNGCLNCPYDYKAVSEPKRSELLLKRKINSK
ncbi:MAG: tRNA (guanosine(46)-N7)-methyltransferase TrmB [Chitinophagaceae bacterium]